MTPTTLSRTLRTPLPPMAPIQGVDIFDDTLVQQPFSPSSFYCLLMKHGSRSTRVIFAICQVSEVQYALCAGRWFVGEVRCVRCEVRGGRREAGGGRWEVGGVWRWASAIITLPLSSPSPSPPHPPLNRPSPAAASNTLHIRGDGSGVLVLVGIE